MITKGKCEVNEHGRLFAVGTHYDAICNLYLLQEEDHQFQEFENAKPNAKFIAEAFNVHNETGLSLRELVKQRDDLLAACLSGATNSIWSHRLLSNAAGIMREHGHNNYAVELEEKAKLEFDAIKGANNEMQ